MRALLAGLTLLLPSCLVNDPRPPPSRILVTASSDDAIRTGIVTEDGWNVGFERFLISLGNASAEDEEGTCNHTYSDPTYQRVLDMRAGSPQKVNLAFALGECTIDLELSAPSEDSPLGMGVTPADRDFMRTPGSDDYETDAALSIHAIGRASKNGVEKTFAWSYRRRLDLASVGAEIDGQLVHTFDFHEDERVTLDFPIRGASLFRDQLSDSGALRFDPIASADDSDSGNHDGEVTLRELGKVPLVGLGGYGDGTEPGVETLEDYIYKAVFRQVVDANPLEVEVFPNDRNPH